MEDLSHINFAVDYFAQTGLGKKYPQLAWVILCASWAHLKPPISKLHSIVQMLCQK